MDCKTCKHLNKNRTQKSDETDHIKYGCDKLGKEGFICGWVYKDFKGSYLGCSDWAPTEEEQLPGQMNIMDYLGG